MTQTTSQELDPVTTAALALVAERDPDDPAAEIGRIYLSVPALAPTKEH